MVAPLWLTFRSNFLILWHPSVHHHSLRHFYRFVDPKLEAHYVQHSTHLWEAMLRIYCVVAFALAFEELFTVLNTTDPLFWSLLSICASSCLLFIASWQMRPLKLPTLWLFFGVPGPSDWRTLATQPHLAR
eukprot:GGOE01048016.1.p1 GENE.GGOE01048016.1~~GGOE01048016.1.p1  ORF type:complete len:138 (+),score=19.86 GGOE01048016.1:23-415(+)